MTTLSGLRSFTPHDRLFPIIEYLCIHMDMEICAIATIQGKKMGRPEEKHFATLLCNQFPLEIQHPIYGPFWGSFQLLNVEAYRLRFLPKQERELTLHSSNKWGQVSEMFWNSTLVFFYEQYRPWLQSTFGRHERDRDKWPEIFRFAWALRNAAAHHNGALNITDPKVPPIIWHHLQYNHTDAGVRVFGDVMTLGDMLVLLIEMSDELDRLHAPRPG